ncbi:MAG: DUF2306 domain-containing protein [Acidobacteria bacterium]|nr:DUF2306 domain-containing protein [Acidobacteriota bacterium]
MATAPRALERAPWLRPKYILFAFVAVMMAYVLGHNESFLLNPRNPVWRHYQPFKWWLLPHGLAGGCAILLGPLQFSDRLRKRYGKWHRVAGRIYVAGALVAAPLGVYIQYFEERTNLARSFTIAAVVNALLLMLTTAIALLFIRQGKVQQHRVWMTRSFAVALVFIEVRVIAGITGWEKLGPSAIETIVWSCLAFSVLLGDLVLQIEESHRVRSTVNRTNAGAAPTIILR